MAAMAPQLWIRHFLRARVSSVTPHSPRLLTAIICIGDATLGAIVAHSPHELAPEVDKNDFYKKLEGSTRQLQRSKKVGVCTLLAHMNARVGSITSQSVGAYGSDNENDNGARMRMYLQCHGLCAANTMCANGCGPTWTGSLGHKARLDYIGLSVSSLPNVSACFVDATVDFATAVREDHAVLVLDQRPSAPPRNDDATEFIEPLSEKKTNRAPIRFNTSALADPSKCEIFQHRLAEIFDAVELGSFIATSGGSPANIDDRLRTWNAEVITLARDFFGPAKSMPKKQWISQVSWAIIEWISPARRKINECQAAARTLMLHTMWGAWKLALGADDKGASRASSATCVLDNLSLFIGSCVMAAAVWAFAECITW